MPAQTLRTVNISNHRKSLLVSFCVCSDYCSAVAVSHTCVTVFMFAFVVSRCASVDVLTGVTELVLAESCFKPPVEMTVFIH